MPNWCSNMVTISHEEKEKIDVIQTELEKKEPKLFNLLRPMPENLIEGDGWYWWCVENWGTKWEPSIMNFNRIDDNSIYISMDTAWSPPISLYMHIEEYGYNIDAHYNEDGLAFAGEYNEGYDDHYEYGGMSADEMEDNLPKKLNELFGLSDRQRDREEEDEWLEEQEDEEDEFAPFEDMDRTDWYPKKVKPVRVGIYEIKTKSWPYPQKAKWNGKKWFVKDVDINEFDLEVKVDEWRGLTESPASHTMTDEELEKALEGLKAVFAELSKLDNNETD